MANQNYQLPQWAKEKQDKLMERVLSEPVLYSGAEWTEQDSEQRETIWKQIAEELQASVIDCKVRVKSVLQEPGRPWKDKFSTSWKSYVPKYNRLKYFAEHCAKQKPIADEKSDVQEVTKEECKQMKTENVHEKEGQNISHQKHSDASVHVVQPEPTQEYHTEHHQKTKRYGDCTSPKNVKKVKIAMQDNTEQTEALSMFNSISPTDMFFQTMAAIVKSLPPTLAIEARVKMCNVIGEIELKALGNHSDP